MSFNIRTADDMSSGKSPTLLLLEQFRLPFLLSLFAGLSTGLGAVVVVMFGDDNNKSLKSIAVWQAAAAGFMTSVCILEIFPEVLSTLTIFNTFIWNVLGFLFIYIVEKFIPEPDLSVFSDLKLYDHIDPETRKQIFLQGCLTAISLAIHNLPEGFAVCMASLKGIEFGTPLAIAIAIHNIPEGMAVALPVYFATNSKYKAIKFSFLSGLAEPLGVIIVMMIGVNFFTDYFISSMLASVGAIMLWISMGQLIPQAIIQVGYFEALSASFMGFVFMSIILIIMDMKLII